MSLTQRCGGLLHELGPDDLVGQRGVVQTGEDGVHQVGRVGRNDPQVVAWSVLELRGVLRVQLGQDRLTAAVSMQAIRGRCVCVCVRVRVCVCVYVLA